MHHRMYPNVTRMVKVHHAQQGDGRPLLVVDCNPFVLRLCLLKVIGMHEPVPRRSVYFLLVAVQVVLATVPFQKFWREVNRFKLVIIIIIAAAATGERIYTVVGSSESRQTICQVQ